MARAIGSYPIGHGFKSNLRYQSLREIPKAFYGPVVKRLRHRPFTAVTRVRFPSGSPPYKLSEQIRFVYKSEVFGAVISRE